MHFFSELSIGALIINLSLAATAQAEKHDAKHLKGVFKSFTTSDYWYVNIEANGKTDSYYCLVPECDSWEQQEAELKGKSVELTVKSRKFYFKEMKTSREIEEVTQLKISK